MERWVDPLRGSRFRAEIRWLFQAALAVFVVTVSIGIFNGFHIVKLERAVLLTHVHAGTIGWITLGVLAISLWLFDEHAVPAIAERFVAPLALVAAVSVPLYVLAFLSGNFVARAVFGAPVLAVIVAFFLWLLGQTRMVRLTIPRLAILAAVTTLTVGSTIGVLVQIQLATKAQLLPNGAIGGHVSAQVVGYLVLIGMGISEWRLVPHTGRLSRLGVAQIALPFGGGLLLTIGALLDIQPLLGAFIPFEIIAVVIYLVRLAPHLQRVPWLRAGSARHFGITVPFLVANLTLLIWLIVGVVVTKTYARFEAIPPWLIFAFDHTMFVGVASNTLFGLIQEVTWGRRSFWPWAEHILFWGMNFGMVGFVLTLAANSPQLEKAFTPIMGGSILVAIVTYTVRLQTGRPARAVPALATG